MKKLLLWGLIGIFTYVPGSYAVYYINVINNTGASVTANINAFNCRRIATQTIPSDAVETKPYQINMSTCCWMYVDFTVADGRYANKKTRALGLSTPRAQFCGDATIVLDIKNGELTSSRK